LILPLKNESRMKGTRNEKLEDEEKKRKKTVITVC
jgi:hypothetical protein